MSRLSTVRFTRIPSSSSSSSSKLSNRGCACWDTHNLVKSFFGEGVILWILRIDGNLSAERFCNHDSMYALKPTFEMRPTTIMYIIRERPSRHIVWKSNICLPGGSSLFCAIRVHHSLTSRFSFFYICPFSDTNLCWPSNNRIVLNTANTVAQRTQNLYRPFRSICTNPPI